MNIDFLTPILIFSIIFSSLFLYRKFEEKMKRVFGSRKFSMREAVVMVFVMGVMVTLVVFMPSYALQILFIFAYSYMLFVFLYIISDKWLLAVFPPIIFIATYLLNYLLIKNIYVLSVFATFFAIMTIVFMSYVFPWKVTLLFATLLTLMDVIQVLWTGQMIKAAVKMVGLYLPVALILPTFPSLKPIALGVGDIFLSGLLSIQTTSKYGRKAGVVSAITISLGFFLFNLLMLNMPLRITGFPATITVLLGWLPTFAFYHFKEKMKSKA